jgi:acyl-coenzyme A thioesterase PaaI-like protein
MPFALFERRGDVVTPLPHAHAVWSADTVDGGAVAALLTQHAEHLCGDPELQLARLTVDLLAPVPVTSTTLGGRTVRQGHRIHVIDVDLTDAGGKIVARASTVFLRKADVAPFAAEPTALRPPPPPEGLAVFPLPMPRPTFFGSQELRPYRVATAVVPMASWVHTPHELFEGVPLTPAAQAAAVADRVNAAGSFVPPSNVGAVNADITVHFGRQPAGDWIAVDVFYRGVGAAQGALAGYLFDRSGAFAVAAMSVMPPRVEGDFEDAIRSGSEQHERDSGRAP